MILEKLKRYLVFILLVPLSIAGFLRKEFSLVLKKRKYLYLSIALPLILGLIYILTLTDSTSSIGVFVCDFDNTQLTESAFLSIDGFYVFRSSDPDCMTDLNQNIIDRNFLFGLQIQNGFTKKINNLEQAGITVFYDE
ncbi:hypothetical protein HON01_10830, partial [Candidatus Woesearchaeota archaeon]|nr:hypothetical protein [Candidatus Woesearchaeota archaeon]